MDEKRLQAIEKQFEDRTLTESQAFHLVQDLGTEIRSLWREKEVLISAKEIKFVPPAVPESEMITYLQKRIEELSLDVARLRHPTHFR